MNWETTYTVLRFVYLKVLKRKRREKIFEENVGKFSKLN